jgi:hypothetical protein
MKAPYYVIRHEDGRFGNGHLWLQSLHDAYPYKSREAAENNLTEGATIIEVSPTMSEASLIDGWINPIDQPLRLTVVGLIDLLHRCQNGEATCMYVAKLIEMASDRDHAALVSAEKALTEAYDQLEPQELQDNRMIDRAVVSIRVALAKVRSQLS